MVSQKVKVINPTGLHLRPAGLFCKTAMQFTSSITMNARNGSVSSNAKSVLSVLGACIKSGDLIEIVCEGIDESEALHQMVTMVEEGLGE